MSASQKSQFHCIGITIGLVGFLRFTEGIPVRGDFTMMVFDSPERFAPEVT
jgi:hypothetical protein